MTLSPPPRNGDRLGSRAARRTMTQIVNNLKYQQKQYLRRAGVMNKALADGRGHPAVVRLRRHYAVEKANVFALAAEVLSSV